MSVEATLAAAYATLAQRADEQDRAARMFGDPANATSRDDLDKALGVIDSPIADEGTGETNVIELRAFIEHVNRTMV